MDHCKKRFAFEGTSRQFVTYIILLTIMFGTFCSFATGSYGTECIVLSISLLFLNLSRKTVIDFAPFGIVSIGTLLILLFSGQISARGFNAPIGHVFKFIQVNLSFQF